MNEVWKPIPNFPGYEVSDYGRIRSYRKYLGGNIWEINKEPQRILKSALSHSGKGYLFVRLIVNNKPSFLSVHTAVLITFIGQPPIGYQCRHKDGDKLNNHLDNLIWGTSKQNCKDRSLHGTKAMGETHPSAKLNNNQVLSLRELAKNGISQKELVIQFGITQTAVSSIILHKTWKHLP